MVLDNIRMQMKSNSSTIKDLDYNFQTMLCGKKSSLSFRKGFILCAKMPVNTMDKKLKIKMKNSKTMMEKKTGINLMKSIQFHILVFILFKHNTKALTSINQCQTKVNNFL